MSTIRVVAEDVIKALRSKYPRNEYAIFEQLRNETGFSGRAQYIDFAAVALWPSRGVTRSAFEVKVARTDFMNEVADPYKNSDFKKFFHEFWYVTAPGVVKEEREIPSGCGWMELRGDRLFRKLVAPRNKDATMDDYLLASFCRNINRVEVSDYAEICKKVLAEDKNHQDMIRFVATVKKFVKSRNGESIYQAMTEENALAALNSCINPRDLKAEAAMLEHLQSKLLEAWRVLTIHCAVSVNEIEETGNKLIKMYGTDSACFGLAVKRLTDGKFGKSDVRDVESADALMQMSKLEAKP